METTRGGYREGSGRKKGTSALEYEKARELLAIKLATEFGPICDKAIEQAKSGDSDARKWLMDRAYGRPKDSVDMNITQPFSLKELGRRREELKQNNLQ